MNIISLDYTESTNDYLKELIKSGTVENYTVITAEAQTKGRGQRGATWVSEHGKNLMMSIYVSDFFKTAPTLFDLNIIVSLSVREALEYLSVPDLYIKWPNDIISCNKKVGGILIENYFKSDNKIESIVGIGINVNQLNFDGLPNASSLAVLCNTVFEREKLLEKIVNNIQNKIMEWEKLRNESWEVYETNLFKIGKPMVFSTADDKTFMGIIKGVSAVGKLQIEREDNIISEFDIKDVQMKY